jgi:hypothetical protein
MTQEEIVMGDGLIAEFMGAKYSMTVGWEFSMFGSVYSNCYNTLRFHSSWDWLMPVVEKIGTLTVKGYVKSPISDNKKYKVIMSFGVNISKSQCTISRDILPQYYGTERDFLDLYDCFNIDKPKIEIVWLSIIAFIKWYNANNKL